MKDILSILYGPVALFVFAMSFLLIMLLYKLLVTKKGSDPFPGHNPRFGALIGITATAMVALYLIHSAVNPAF